MEYLILFIVIGLALAFYLKKELNKRDVNQTFAYKKKKYFFSKAEKKFYEVLKEVADDMDMVVFSKVRLADLVYLPRSDNNWWKGWNKIKSKHIDFVLCGKGSYGPQVAIELNDNSHQKTNRVKRDKFLRKALDSAELNLVEIEVAGGYSKEEVKMKIAGYKQQNTTNSSF